jgi:two-component system, response regulator YesN
MIRTLIVDDDVEMLQGLTNIINWEDYGFSIVGRAINGFEALNIISDIMPDVVITDITMPVMNGLELIREAKKFNPNIKSIIISCHEEFNYAREAIRLEADEYIIKYTLTEEGLINVLNELKIKIDNECVQRENLSKANRELNINKYVILEKFYNDIMENNIPNKEEINNRSSLSNITLPSGNFRLISFFVDNPDEVMEHSPIKEYSLFKFCILNIIEETIKGTEHMNVFSYDKSAFALLYWDNSDEVLIKQKIISMIKDIQYNIKLILIFKMSVCFSSVYKDVLNLKRATDETEALRMMYFYQGSGEIIMSGREFKNKDSNVLYKEFGPEFRGALCIQKRSELVECLNKIFTRIVADDYSPNSIRTLLRRLIVDMEAALDKYEVSMEVFQIKGDTFIMYRKIVEDALEYMLEKLSESRNITIRSEIKKVVEYIETHINEEISCENMAGYINMNSNYFSRLFKNEIGMSFSDYTVNRRMNVATELLNNSNYSIEEITKAIGIDSISYFYRAYKKITGKTPGDVRNRARLF